MTKKKALVLLKIGKEGILVYLIASLLEMADFGGTDTHSLKNTLSNVANDTENVLLAEYGTKLISATSDRANVNLSV